MSDGTVTLQEWGNRMQLDTELLFFLIVKWILSGNNHLKQTEGKTNYMLFLVIRCIQLVTRI